MVVTFLGTGTSQGVPVIACNCDVCLSSNKKDKRLRSAILIEEQSTTLVIDTGPDFRQQMLRANVQQLDAVLFTHEHKDHIAGLDDVRAFNFKQQADMPIYASEQVQKALKREFYYAFTDTKYPGVPKLEVRTIKTNQFRVNNLEINPIKVWHYKMPVLGFRINNFVYITDANRIEESEKNKMKNADVIVLNALRKEKHISHFTLQEAIDLLKELKPKKAYLTHISHLMGLHNNISKELPGFIELAYDGLEITC